MITEEQRTKTVTAIIAAAVEEERQFLASMFSIGPGEARFLALIRFAQRFPEFLTSEGVDAMESAEQSIVDLLTARLAAVRSAATDEELQAIMQP